MENHKDTKDDKKKHTNKLINSASPYLLQHAHNPVNWYEWGEEAWKEAKIKDKLVLVSIGYAACHWCHVMEHESFEDVPTAELMNQVLVNIKVDREERPDIDQIYMDACTMINGSGGWPLNVICLPDGRPFFAGTYFRNKDWNQLLIKLNNLYSKDKAKALKYADNIEKGLKQMDTLKPASILNLSEKMFKNAANIMLESFDFEYGGRNHAPKFPTPCVYTYLLDNYLLQGSKQSLDITNLTLNKMRLGGLNDLVGGGFTRYSTDKKWFAPHFEKMLYDNGQLMELYVKAYRVTKNKYFLQTAEHIATFIDRELTDDKGGFYSSLDADSEGQEGKFYVWTKNELSKILGKDADHFNEVHAIQNKGNWEHDNNILHRDELEEKDAKKLKLSEDTFNILLERSYNQLLKERKKRVRPGTDDKVLTSWNGLAISGLARLYQVTGNKKHLSMAQKSLHFIENEMLDSDLNLLRTYRKGKKHISGFLDDYAHLAKAYIDMYDCEKDENLLIKAKNLTAHIVANFYDKTKNIFYFTSNNSEKLISRKVELSDSVIPSSNAIMALNLIKIGYIFGLTEYPAMAQEMLKQVANKIESSVSWFSQWAVAALYVHHGFNQIVVTGKHANKITKKLEEIYVPNAIILKGDKNSKLETISKKAKNEKTLIYMCKDFTCGLPYEDVEVFLEGMK